MPWLSIQALLEIQMEAVVMSTIPNISISTFPVFGYNFSGWTGDTEHLADINSSTTYLILPDQNITITPNFTPKTYQITITSDENGTVSGGGSYTYGSIANIVPTGNVNNSSIHTFANWTITDEDGQKSLRSDNPLKLFIDGNYSITAI